MPDCSKLRAEVKVPINDVDITVRDFVNALFLYQSYILMGILERVVSGEMPPREEKS